MINDSNKPEKTGLVYLSLCSHGCSTSAIVVCMSSNHSSPKYCGLMSTSKMKVLV